MILVDIDVKVEKISVTPLITGMSAVFELKDKNNLDTVLILQFYKRQIDFIMKKFYEVDLKKLKESLRVEFVKREEIVMKELKKRILELEIEVAFYEDQYVAEHGGEDAKATD